MMMVQSNYIFYEIWTKNLKLEHRIRTSYKGPSIATNCE